MPKNTSIILGDHFEEFIKSEMESGRYASASEVIRNGLRLLQEKSNRIEAINQALIQGENSGDAREFNNEEFKNSMRQKFAKNG